MENGNENERVKILERRVQELEKIVETYKAQLQYLSGFVKGLRE